MIEARPRPQVCIHTRRWERRGHGGLSAECDHTVFVNHQKIRTFSTHGSMDEGYWGAKAGQVAQGYAIAVAKALGLRTILRIEVGP
jgi:hypothetical protein